MRSILKKIDGTAESAFNVAGSSLRFAASELRQHPFTTPLVFLGGALLAKETFDRIERWERQRKYTQQEGIDATRQHVAELALHEEIELNTPEIAEDDR